MKGLKAAGSLLLAAALMAPASAGAEEAPSPVRAMMIVSGMVEQFSDFGETFRAGISAAATQSPGLPPDLVEALGDIGARVMDGEAFVDDLEVELEATLSPGEIEDFAAFYRTSFGQRIRQVELANSTPDVQLEIEHDRAALRAELERDPERLALAEDVDRTHHTSELAATTTVSMMRALAIGMVEGAGQGGPEVLAAVDAKIEQMHAPIVAHMHEVMLAIIARTYRDLSNEELAEYVEFLNTESVRAVCAALSEAESNFMTVRSRQIGEEFGALIRQKKT